MRTWHGRRVHLDGSQWRERGDVPWHKVWAGHGGDEYGNCSLYLQTLYFGITLFPGPHFQDQVEVPRAADPGLRWQEWLEARRQQ